MTAIRIATCRPLPEPDPDEAPLCAALEAGGFAPQLLAWDDPGIDWDAPIPTVIRATWNYPRKVGAFLAWVDRVARAAPLFNPPDVVRANVHKRYLLALAAKGVPVVPTTLVERGGTCDLAAMRGRIVIKPEVGAGSFGARSFAEASEPEAAVHLAGLTASGAALVQPYVASVEGYGERSIVAIDGAVSHAIRKSPRFAGQDERVDGPFPIADDERAVAEAALAAAGAADLLYGRVDMARDAAGHPMVMELELVEPSLFFARGPGAVERFVAGLRRRLLQ